MERKPTRSSQRQESWLKMEYKYEWLNHQKFVFLSPQRFSWFSEISLKGVHLLIENEEIDFVCIGKKRLIPVPTWKYYSTFISGSQDPVEQLEWKEYNSSVPY